MTDRLAPYPKYRDSGVPSISAIPAHWHVRRLGQIGRLRKGSGGNKEDEVSAGIPCVRYGDLYTTHSYFIEESRSFINEEIYTKYTSIEFGDVLFAASGETIDEIGKSAVNLMRSRACCGGDVIVFSPRSDVVARYMGYAMDCYASTMQKATMGRGFTVIHIYAAQLKHLAIPIPPLPEQAAIARYLDRVGDRVDRYIDARQRLIDLLIEKKQAIIDRAVTRGLDPNATMKPTGIDWMPEAPAHWHIRRMRNVADVRVSNVDKHIRDGEKSVRLCNYTDVYKNDYIHQKMNFMRSSANSVEVDRFHLEKDDVLITKDSETWDDIAVPALVIESAADLIAGYHLALLRPQIGVIRGDYLFRALQCGIARYQFHTNAAGVTRYGLSNNGIKSVRLPVPPLAEQATIVEYLERKVADIDAMIDSAYRQIELLCEYRERLINDVVTGKLDVPWASVETAPRTADHLHRAAPPGRRASD